MGKKNKLKNKNGKNGNGKNNRDFNDKETLPILTNRVKKTIAAVCLFILAIIVAFSFFQKSGSGGETIFKVFDFLVGEAVYVLPFLLLLTGFLILRPRKRRIFLPASFVLGLCTIGVSGILSTHNSADKAGGWVGYLFSWPVFHYFGSTVSYIVFACFVLIGGIIIFEMLPKGKDKEEKQKEKDAKLAKQAGENKEKPKFEIKPVEVIKTSNSVSEKALKKAPIIEVKKEKPKALEPAVFLDTQYKFPPVELLEIGDEKPSSGDIEFNAQAIKKTLQNFGIEVEMSEINVGPTVTQYTLKPADGVKLSKLTGLNNDLALALAAHPIRIEAPIPGKSFVGIEVPNSVRAKVKIGSVIASPVFQNPSSILNLALGKDVMGAPICVDLAGMPHMLVAGATGSGKSICLNTIINSLIFRNSPKNLRLILIDPKRVEFPVYGALPHLLTPVILNSRKAVNVLNWLVGEMERRFEVLQEAGARDIISYNKGQQQKALKVAKKANVADTGDDTEPMPYIVLIVDELADLMMAKGKEVEAAIVRLSQLARAVGIHLVVATQRPSVEVITGLIKANITTRIAFQVASQIDSRTILDAAGAEKLLGKGDMLYISAEFSRPKRIQGNFITSQEVKKVVDFIAKENAPQEMQNIEEHSLSEDGEVPQARPMVSGVGANNHDDIVNFSAKDPLYEEAKEIVVKYQKASASLLQRRMQVGYARAARILDALEEDGVIGAADGAKPREVLIGENGNLLENDGYHDAGDVEFERE
ncbi:MAG: DNA translocase FtsK [Candidatus Pacebacteria bacterium]|nr:DNA translocase FtsK [Candidatus Paceibacterota bacterium]